MARIISDKKWHDIESDLYELAKYRASGITPEEIRDIVDKVGEAPDILPLWDESETADEWNKQGYMA